MLRNDIAWQRLPAELGFGSGPAGGASSAGSGPESWPRRRPEALLGDKGFDSNPNRDELRKRRILPVISRKGSPNINGLGTLRYVVEQTFALLHQFKRLAVRWERRTELHNAFASLACSLICRRRLKKTSHDRATSSEHGHR